MSVVGSGGIGKSRLAWEFEKYLDGIVERVWWHHGRSPAYGEGITFWALGEMIRGRCRLAETDDEATTRAKVARDGRRAHAATTRARAGSSSALLALLGVEDGRGLGRAVRRVADVLRAAGRHGARGAWSSRTSTGRTRARSTSSTTSSSGSRASPIFILTLARPELLDRRPDWGAGQRDFTSLYLEPLPEPADAGPARRPRARACPDGPCEAIVARAEGIPLYAVETVRMLVRGGPTSDPEGDGTYRPIGDLTTLAVPETLTALIAARLDALDPADRALLLDAAVLGQSFTPAALAAVSGRTTDELEPDSDRSSGASSGHVADARIPERGQYAFVQALVREVAYNTLAQEGPQDRHLAAARWFETLGSDGAGGRARRPLPRRPRARGRRARGRCARGAGADRARGRGRPGGGTRRSSPGRSRSSSRPSRSRRIRPRSPSSTGGPASRRRSSPSTTAARHIFSRRSPTTAPPAIARPRPGSISALGSLLITGRRLDRAAAILEPAAEEFADLVDDPSRLVLVSQLARAHFFIGNLERSVELADQVIVDAERSDNLLVLADTLVTKGSVLANLNRRHEGLALIDAGGRIAEANGFTNVTFRAINNALSNRTEEFPRAAYDSAAAGLALARRLGQAGWVHSFAGNFAYVSQRVGEWDAGITELRGALAEATDPLDRLLSLNNLINLLALREEPRVSELEE